MVLVLTHQCVGTLILWGVLALGGFLGRGDGVERGVGRVASRRVKNVVVVVLGDGWDLDIDG